MSAHRGIWIATSGLLLAGCGDSHIYTLYRSSVVDGVTRIHVATFDASDSTNQENCQIAADLFQHQPGVTVRFWCEKGRYRE